MDRGISPAGGEGMVSPCGATYFAHVGKVGKAPPGDGVSKNTPCFYAASPGPPLFLRGSHQGVWKNLPGAGKGQDTAPCAARCRSVLAEQAHSPTRVIAPSAQPSRGGSVVGTPPGLVADT